MMVVAGNKSTYADSVRGLRSNESRQDFEDLTQKLARANGWQRSLPVGGLCPHTHDHNIMRRMIERGEPVNPQQVKVGNHAENEDYSPYPRCAYRFHWSSGK